MSASLCFYPNGNPSLEEDIPCGTGDAVGCCPLNWSCQPNGLCYLEDQDYYGRYTCTDNSWGSGCPNICTYGNTAAGNEAVLECTPGSFCCDTNRPELSGGTNCCDASPSRFSIDGVNEVNSTDMQPFTSTDIYPTNSAPAPSSESFMAYPTYTTFILSYSTEEDSSPTSDSAYSNVSPTPFTQSSSTEEDSSPTSDSAYSNVSPTPFTQSSSTLENSSPTSDTAYSNFSPTLVCDVNSGEELCGSICCATDQFCAFAGQCSSISAGSSSSSDTAGPGSFSSAKPSTSAVRSQSTTFSNSVTRPSFSSPSVAASPDTATLLPNSGKPTITSAATTPTTTVVLTPAANPSPITKSPGFKAGVAVGTILAVACILVVIAVCFRRRRARKQKLPRHEYDTVVAQPTPVGPYPYESTRPPQPDPYSGTSYLQNQAPTDNSSCLGPELVPDNQSQTPRPQPNLQFAPAQNPYEYPTTPQGSMSEPNLSGQHPARWQSYSATPPPSYTTYDQLGRLRRPG